MTTEKKQINDFLLRDGESQSSTLHRPGFDVNMRLFRGNIHYRSIILQVCDYLCYLLDQEFGDYSKKKGVSASTLAIPFNIIAFTDGDIKRIIINPKITHESPETKKLRSNCGALCLKQEVEVMRYVCVVVEGYNEHGDLITIRSESNAGLLQHQIDHTQGILITDRSKLAIKDFIKNDAKKCSRCKTLPAVVYGSTPLCSSCYSETYIDKMQEGKSRKTNQTQIKLDEVLEAT